jgi:hypothetical protein
MGSNKFRCVVATPRAAAKTTRNLQARRLLAVEPSRRNTWLCTTRLPNHGSQSMMSEVQNATTGFRGLLRQSQPFFLWRSSSPTALASLASTRDLPCRPSRNPLLRTPWLPQCRARHRDPLDSVIQWRLVPAREDRLWLGQTMRTGSETVPAAYDMPPTWVEACIAYRAVRETGGLDKPAWEAARSAVLRAFPTLSLRGAGEQASDALGYASVHHRQWLWEGTAGKSPRLADG